MLNSCYKTAVYDELITGENMKKNLFILIYMALLSALLFADEKVQIQKITASSTLSEKGKASDFYGTENLTDNSYKSWVEGVDGDGTGESITFEFEKPVNITGIGIRNGYGDARYYFANNRVKHFDIYINGKYKKRFRLADTFELYNYSFLRFENVSSITFKIKDVYKGFKYDDTCMNEIYFYTDFDEDIPVYTEDDFAQNLKKAFPDYSKQFDKVLYTKDGTPLLLHPIDSPNLNDIWCFNDMEFYIYKNGKWNIDNSNPIFALLRNEIEKAKNNKYQILFSFGQASGYEENLYGYILQVTAPSYTIYEYDFDGISFKIHDAEYKSER